MPPGSSGSTTSTSGSPTAGRPADRRAAARDLQPEVRRPVDHLEHHRRRHHPYRLGGLVADLAPRRPPGTQRGRRANDPRGARQRAPVHDQPGPSTWVCRSGAGAYWYPRIVTIDLNETDPLSNVWLPERRPRACSAGSRPGRGRPAGWLAPLATTPGVGRSAAGSITPSPPTEHSHRHRSA